MEEQAAVSALITALGNEIKIYKDLTKGNPVTSPRRANKQVVLTAMKTALESLNNGKNYSTAIQNVMLALQSCGAKSNSATSSGIVNEVLSAVGSTNVKTKKSDSWSYSFMRPSKAVKLADRFFNIVGGELFGVSPAATAAATPAAEEIKPAEIIIRARIKALLDCLCREDNLYSAASAMGVQSNEEVSSSMGVNTQNVENELRKHIEGLITNGWTTDQFNEMELGEKMGEPSQVKHDRLMGLVGEVIRSPSAPSSGASGSPQREAGIKGLGENKPGLGRESRSSHRSRRRGGDGGG